MRGRVPTFRLVLIKPSHYDDDGYVIQWRWAAIPSNSLAALHGLAEDCRRRRVLGEDVDIATVSIDECNTRIRPARLARLIERGGAGGLVALVGVQSNQFPRALDLARQFRARGLAVCIGGFHVSGCIAMLPELPPDLAEAQALGISLFAGEAEGRLDEVLCDAAAGRLKPVYNYLDQLPSLAAATLPILPVDRVRRTIERMTSFDAGRGCPFQCSFCTIINVQGRISRRRSADDVEAIIRENLAQGVHRFFITDDNFARNRDWEAILDRMIRLREQEGVKIRCIIQVDTLCHRIPGFIEKAARAGVNRVFIGLENINPDSLMGAKKRQNKITEYRRMLLAWRAVGITTYCGYIIGFPKDTPESVARDIEIVKRELPVDVLEFFFLTPLPGSEDHQRLHRAGVPMDPDMNNYDIEHVTTAHPLMSREQWEETYHRAWQSYYSLDHMETVLRRAYASGMSVGRLMALLFTFRAQFEIEKLHPLQGGVLRRRYRRDRRPTLPREPVLVFHARYLGWMVSKQWRALLLYLRFLQLRHRVKHSPEGRSYRDIALTPVADEEVGSLELFSASEAARAAAEKAQHEAALRAAKVLA
jgi:radical SAM superfamily enzyme YgiQ (UPF0313 family)